MTAWRRPRARHEEAPAQGPPPEILALGVLLWEVAAADARFLPAERERIREILCERGGVSPQEWPRLEEIIARASRERIDLYAFTHEVRRDLSYVRRQALVAQLFRVACSDGDLAHEEEECIRRISGLLGLDHRDFIAAKIQIKKESGLPTVSD